MITSAPTDTDAKAIEDFTLAEIEQKLNDFQQLMQALFTSSGSYMPLLLPNQQPNNSAVPHDQTEADSLYQQAQQLHQQQQWQQAARLFCKAAYLGLLPAQSQLAHCYLKGQGVPKSAVFAYSWFILAALQQDSGAQQACTVLCKHLSVQDQQQAQRLAAERFEKITLKNNY